MIKIMQALVLAIPMFTVTSCADGVMLTIRKQNGVSFGLNSLNVSDRIQGMASCVHKLTVIDIASGDIMWKIVQNSRGCERKRLITYGAKYQDLDTQVIAQPLKNARRYELTVEVGGGSATKEFVL